MNAEVKLGRVKLKDYDPGWFEEVMSLVGGVHNEQQIDDSWDKQVIGQRMFSKE